MTLRSSSAKDASIETSSFRILAPIPDEELAQLLMCEDVPVRWRRIFALTVYMALRAGELAALECEDVDLTRGRVRIDKAVNRDTGKVGPTKTEDTRVLDVPKTLIPLLESLIEEASEKGLLIPMPPIEDLASQLRVYAARAGLTRRELFERTKMSIPLRFHDLRATGISHLAMLPGLSQFDIRDYAGHSEVATTDRHVRRGRKVRDSVAAPFGAIPESLLLVEKIGITISEVPQTTKPASSMLVSVASPTRFEDGRKPTKRRQMPRPRRPTRWDRAIWTVLA